ncbi:MAG TPA: LysR substrate-binding domain-containing protein [Gammaproteobacteria bacterium]
MTLTELRYIVALARERHFGRAAESCHVSQPTLSVGVKKLEDELGVVLFERSKTDISLTPVGERIVEQAQRALDEAGVIKELAQGARDELAGPLRLGAIYTIGPYLFPHLIPLLHERLPQMPLVIEENYTARLGEKLKQGELDAILIALPFAEAGIVTQALYEEPFVVVLPTAHPWTARDQIAATDLGAEDETLLMLGAGHCFREQVLAACPACRHGSRQLQKNLEGGSLETIRHMVASGMGITVLPCSAAGADRYSQRLLSIRRFAPPAPSRTVALAWRRHFPRPRALAALTEAVRDCELSCVTPINDSN